MPKLQVVSGVVTPDSSLTGDIRDLHVIETANGPLLISTTGVNGGLVSYQLSSGQGAQTYESVAFLPSESLDLSGEIAIISHNGQDVAVIGTSTTGAFGYVLNENGSFGDLVEIEGLGTTGELSALHDSSAGIVFMAEFGGSGIGVYSQSDAGVYTRTGSLQDTEESHLTDVVCLASSDLTDSRIVLAASRGETGISSYCLNGETGEILHIDSLGVQDGLGLLPEIVGLETVSAYGASFAITASSAPEYGAGALSVMKIAEDGSLIAMDHVLDTLSTRFGQVQSLSTVTVGDRVYVMAGGGDDGLTLFLLLPNGRLLHLDSYAHGSDVSLENVSAIAATQVGDEVQVLAASGTTPGLTQLSFSVAEQGITLTGRTANAELTGTSGDDILCGGSGNDVLTGDDGHDILLDGAGRDTLIGGGGNDVFVLGEDGEIDRIEDFRKGQDQIDLSAYTMLYDPSALEIESTPTGALIHWRGETLEVIRQGGGSLTRSDIINAIIIGPDRPPMVVGRKWEGTDGDDALSGLWGDDTLIGGAGNDHLTGDIGNDSLFGDNKSDTLIGGAGNDTVLGGNGADTAFLGEGDDLYTDTRQGKEAGRDWIDGGDGNDTIKGGGGNDTLAGGAHDDVLRGQVGDDMLYGQSGNDRLVGNAGNDLLYGGDGRDRLIGGRHDDILMGETGNDVLRAGGGNDTVDGGDGRDRAWLGTGDDLWLDTAQTNRVGSDKVWGGDGNDTIISLAGGDTLTGDAGSDTFIFSGPSGHREITDFDPNEDILRIEMDGMTLDDFALNETPDGLVLSWTGGKVALTGVHEGDMVLSDIIFDLG